MSESKNLPWKHLAINILRVLEILKNVEISWCSACHESSHSSDLWVFYSVHDEIMDCIFMEDYIRVDK